MKEKFSVRLKKAMQLRNMRASELSKKSGIAPPMISDYLKGKYCAKQNNLYILAKVLDVNEPWLMGYDVPIERIPDEKRDISKDETIYKRINELNDKQKDAVISILDNMN